MYQFVKFSDLGPFTDIVHSNARFVNAPVGMLLDRQGRVIGHRLAPLSTRRFGTFQGTAGEDPNVDSSRLFDIPAGDAPVMATPVAPTPAVPTPIAETKIEEEEIPLSAFFGEEEAGEFGFEEAIIDEIVREELAKRSVRRRAQSMLQKASQSISAIRRGAKRLSKSAKKKAVKKAALAGIKASNKGDDSTAELVAMREAKESGLSPAEVKAVGEATKQKVKKHMEMENKEASIIAGEIVEASGESEGKHAAGVKRGRPAGSKTAKSPNPLLNLKSQKDLKAIGQTLGFKTSYFRNRSVSIDSITEAASRANTPLGLVVEAAEGKTSIPAAVTRAVQQMETERKSRGRTLARGTSRIRGVTRQPRRAESPAAFVANPSGRGRGSYKRVQKRK